MLEIKRKISPYNHYDYNNPKYLVFHYVGAQGSTAANNATYFFNGDRQASAHYFVDDKEIWQSVEDLCGAWSVGNTRTEVNNQNSINIEMCCMGPNLLVTETTENNTIELGAYLMKKYNIPIGNVRSHYEVTAQGKLCPNFANTPRWSTFKNKLQAKLNNTNSSSNNSSSTDIIYRVKLANGEQIGAFRNLDSAKNLAQLNKCNVYSSVDNSLVVSYVNNSDVGLGYLNLKPHMSSWRVYPLDGPYTTNYSVGALAPATYGGLSYKILEKKTTDVYKIKTESFGIVSIYAPRDNDSSITNNPIY